MRRRLVIVLVAGVVLGMPLLAMDALAGSSSDHVQPAPRPSTAGELLVAKSPQLELPVTLPVPAAEVPAADTASPAPDVAPADVTVTESDTSDDVVASEETDPAADDPHDCDHDGDGDPTFTGGGDGWHDGDSGADSWHHHDDWHDGDGGDHRG